MRVICSDCHFQYLTLGEILIKTGMLVIQCIAEIMTEENEAWGRAAGSVTEKRAQGFESP